MSGTGDRNDHLGRRSQPPRWPLLAVSVVALTNAVFIVLTPREAAAVPGLLAIPLVCGAVLIVRARRLRDAVPPTTPAPPPSAPLAEPLVEHEPSLVMLAAASLARRGRSAGWIAATFELPLALAEMLVREARDHRPI